MKSYCLGRISYRVWPRGGGAVLAARCDRRPRERTRALRRVDLQNSAQPVPVDVLRRQMTGAMCGLALFTILTLTCFFCQDLYGQSGDGWNLDRVLQQIEAVGKSFTTFQAQFTKKKYTAVLEEFDIPESGEFLYSRAKDGSALLRQEVKEPGSKILTIKRGHATLYEPRLKQAQLYNLGKNRDKAEYLALGLGQSPAKLQETFHIKYEGGEIIDGAPCSKLTLEPKNPSAAAYFSAITLWIKRANGVPIQQKLMEPSGDYLLVSFSGEKLNRSIPSSKFEQKLPKDVQILRIQ
jgi:outer membrane lipoprotein-sorting protein